MAAEQRPAPLAGGNRARVGNARQQPDATMLAETPVDFAEIEFEHSVARLHRYGEHALTVFLAELAAARMICSEIEAMLARHLAHLDAEIQAIERD